MKIAQRLGLGFTVLLCLFGAYGLFTLDRMGALVSLTDKLYAYPHAVSTLVLRSENHILSINGSVEYLTSVRDSDRIAAFAVEIEEHQRYIYRNFEALDRRFQGDADVLVDARQSFTKWEEAVHDIVTLKLDGRHADAEARLGRTYAERVEALEGNMRLLANGADAEAAQFIAYAHEIRDAARAATLSLFILMIVIAGGLALWLTNSIRRPLDALRDAASRVTRGDLHVEMNVPANDEFQDLAASFEEMVGALRDAVLRQNIQKIRRIAIVVSESAATIEDLGASSREISKIVRVIGDIADQTNLLALNAAIEAARGGDNGRGFAVIADEVRKLAERTTQGTNQIATVIETMQSKVERATTSVHYGRDQVVEGLETSDSRHAITHIARASEELTALVNDLQHRTDRFSVQAAGDGHEVRRQNGSVDITLGGDGATSAPSYADPLNETRRSG